eukprot:2856073-Prymnesium_polylepis.1
MAQVGGTRSEPPLIELILGQMQNGSTLPRHAAHGHTLFCASRFVFAGPAGVGKKWHKVRKILNMVTIDGKCHWQGGLGRP